MSVVATPAGTSGCWDSHSGAEGWKLVQLMGLGGNGSADCVGLIAVASPSGVSASFLHFCPLCLHRQRQSFERLQRS